MVERTDDYFIDPQEPGETYYLTVGQGILCEPCLGTSDAIRVTDDLAVVVEGERLLIRRGASTVAVLTREARHLVEASVERVTRVVDG